MNEEKCLETICTVGTLLLESGAEVRRVEETMVRMATSMQGVQYADSYVTLTGITFSMTIDGKTHTRIARVRNTEVNLDRIDQINNLSRTMCSQPFTVEQVEKELERIQNRKRYDFLVTMFFGGIGAGAFAIFFDGTVSEMIASFFVGLIIRCTTSFMAKYNLNASLNTMFSAAIAAFLVILIHTFFPSLSVDCMMISSLMLLVPGLAITNAIRDTIAGDTLSGLARAADAFLCAISIAVGAGFVLYFWM